MSRILTHVLTDIFLLLSSLEVSNGACVTSLIQAFSSKSFSPFDWRPSIKNPWCWVNVCRWWHIQNICLIIDVHGMRNSGMRFVSGYLLVFSVTTSIPIWLESLIDAFVQLPFQRNWNPLDSVDPSTVYVSVHRLGAFSFFGQITTLQIASQRATFERSTLKEEYFFQLWLWTHLVLTNSSKASKKV